MYNNHIEVKKMFTRTENFKQYISYYPVVSIIIAINVLTYIGTILPGIGDEILFRGMSINGFILEGDYYRIVTSMFLHGGFLHLLFNMFSLFLFGPELEKFAGKVRFITIYFVSGIIGNIITLFAEPDYWYASVGASGAIFGMIGAFGALVYYTRHIFPQLKQIILPIIIISVVMTFIQPNINIAAHLGGMACGFLIGLVFFNPKKLRRIK